jgi:hypothetical protein
VQASRSFQSLDAPDGTPLLQALAVTMYKELYLSEIEKRLTIHFSASRDGYKPPASDRHHLEGFIHGAIFMGLATRAELSKLMEEIHFSIFGKTIEERSNDSRSLWQELDINYEKYDQPTYERRNS